MASGGPIVYPSSDQRIDLTPLSSGSLCPQDRTFHIAPRQLNPHRTNYRPLELFPVRYADVAIFAL